MATSNDEASKQSGVAAVDRALAIVAALASSAAPMTLSELSRASQLYKSTILRLLESLERAQYVSRLPDGRYVLGSMAYRLGMAYERTNNVVAHVAPILDELVAAGTESASFHIPYSPGQRLCILRKDSNHSTLDSVRAGQVLPLKGAAGKVVRAFQDDAASALRQARVVESYGERDASCAGLACPVLGSEGRFIGALSLSGPIGRFTPEAVARMSSLLFAAAQRASERFGGRLEGDPPSRARRKPPRKDPVAADGA